MSWVVRELMMSNVELKHIIAHKEQINAAEQKVADALIIEYQEWLQAQPEGQRFPPVVLYIPHGGIYAAVDLTRALNKSHLWQTIHFGYIHYSRYAEGFVAKDADDVSFTTCLPEINKRFVVVVDDVVDKGVTLARGVASIKSMGASRVISYSVCHKANQLDTQLGVNPDYAAVTVHSRSDLFLLGQGMDGNHLGRHEQHIRIHPDYITCRSEDDRVEFYSCNEVVE
jgi:hypoxanthine-guanine phosphoribosyltransferase